MMEWLDTAITYRHVLYMSATVVGVVVALVIGALGYAWYENAMHTRHARRYIEDDMEG